MNDFMASSVTDDGDHPLRLLWLNLQVASAAGEKITLVLLTSISGQGSDQQFVRIEMMTTLLMLRAKKT